MRHIAHLDGTDIVNVSLWDGVTEVTYSEPVVEIPEGLEAGIGWSYIDGEFIDLRPEPEDPDPAE